MKEQNRYYAFISYNSVDEKWAKWLQNKLEYYHIPSALYKEYPELPKKIRPIFWYKQDLSGTRLKKALNDELSSSKYLIVICSPDSAKADWVNDEVETFISQGKGDKIIPFIVAGTPHASKESDECFPPALLNLNREEEIRGIDVHRKEGKYHALVDVIATMFGVRFDALWQRHERRRKKIRNLWIAVASVLLLFTLGIYDYSRTKVEYYADWVDCNGIAQGVVPLSDEQVGHRYYSFKFEYSRVPFGEKEFYTWRLNSVSIVNSHGVISNYTPGNHAFFYPIQEYKYTDGYVTEIVNRDTYNRVTMRYTVKDDYDYRHACLIDMEGKEKHQGSTYLNSSTTSLLPDNNQNMSKIKRFHYTRNEKGYITKVTYHANDADELEESAIGDNNNIYGKLFDLDSIGRVRKVTYINHEGKPMTDKYGVGYIRYNNASFEKIDTVEYLGSDGNLAYNEQKFARMISKIDKYGNPIEQWYEGADEKPCFNYQNIHRQVINFNDKGYMIEVRYYDFEGNLTYCAENYAIQRGKYDSRGRAIEVSHYDVNDKPCYTKDNYHILRTKYDSNDRIVESSFFDIKDNPCFEKNNGAHTIKAKYDKHNYIIERSIFNTTNKPDISPIAGYCKEIIKFDDYHRVLSIKVYNIDGTPGINIQDNTSEWRFSYDSRGNLIQLNCIGTNDKPCICKYGYASRNYKYDAYGNQIEESYYGIQNEPVYINMYNSIQYDYYPNGLIKEIRHYDENGKLCLNKDWYAMVRYEYDANGHQTKASYFDTDLNLCLIKDGLYSILKFEYDHAGNVIKESFYDENGKLALNGQRYAIGTLKYDNYRRVVESNYFDKDYNPCYTEDGFHKRLKEYDTKGNIIKNSFFNHTGTPVNTTTTTEVVGYEFDDKNNCTKIEFMDANGRRTNKTRKGYSIEKRIIDNLGRTVKIEYLDKDEKPCWNSTTTYSYSIIKQEYDQFNNIISYQYFDPEGNLTNASGAAEIKTDYDKFNRMIKREYRDKMGALIPGEFYQKAIELYKYNKLNLLQELSLYNADSTFYVNHIFKYDTLGQHIASENRDINGNLKVAQTKNLGNVPYAILKIGRDNFGRRTSYSYYDENYQLTNISDGYATEKWAYDNYGRCIMDAFFDKDGKATCSFSLACHKTVGIYNEKGLLAELSYFDENEEYIDSYAGSCKWEYTYNEKGQLIDQIVYHAQQGKAVKQNTPENQNIIERKANGSFLVGYVVGAGRFQEKGYTGTYFFLAFNDWCIYDDLTIFSEVMTTTANDERHIIMVPWEKKENGEYGLGELIDLIVPAGFLGVQFVDNPGDNDLFNTLIDIYENQVLNNKK